jgi:hypothetical protein
MWLLYLAYATIRYCLTQDEWECANCGEPVSVCQGKCRRNQR